MTGRTNVGLLATAAVAAMLIVDPGSAYAAASGVDLGTADGFAVLAGQTVTNTGPTMISGNLGVSPGSAVTGFPPGVVVAGGSIHAADASAAQAQVDLTTAYNNAAGQASDAVVTGDLGGQTLTPGVYRSPSSLGITGTLTLDAQGDPNAVFFFQMGSTVTTASASTVLLINGASACNVFWQVGSSATLGTSSTFAGTILALTSITVTTGVTITGRALARNGAVTLDTNSVTRPPCPQAPAAPTDLAATPRNGSARLVFTPPVNDGGSAITSYDVSTDGGDNWHPLTVATAGGTRTATVRQLTNGQTYVITVRADNLIGTGAPAETVEVTPVAPPVDPDTVPGAPTALTIVAGNGRAALTFIPPAVDGGSPITGYEVSTDDGSTWSSLSVATGAGGVRTATVTGLDDGTTYSVRVRARNAVGAGTPGSAAAVTTGVSPTAVSA